ncbi:MAG: hypothetical protein COA33_002365 [Fluviicola sp.]|nr:hypothetical protein [Fluviicola sp.]
MKQVLILLFLSVTINSFSQNFKAKVDSIYDFHPHKMSDEEQRKIFKKLDVFFEMVIADTGKYLPLLRQELNTEDHTSYFYYDAAHLLIINSESSSDLNLAVKSFVKSDIRDLSPKNYVNLLMGLAKKGINITDAAVKILSDSTFSFFIPQHAMTFNQGYCLLFCLSPLPVDYYTDTLISIFRETNSIVTQKSIITTLWFSYSCKGDEFLNSLTPSNTLDKKVSKYAKDLLGRILSKEYEDIMEDLDSEELNKMFDSGDLLRFSDESIHYLNLMVKLKRKKLNCR